MEDVDHQNEKHKKRETRKQETGNPVTITEEAEVILRSIVKESPRRTEVQTGGR